jgi:hypothetical protein
MWNIYVYTCVNKHANCGYANIFMHINMHILYCVDTKWEPGNVGVDADANR